MPFMLYEITPSAAGKSYRKVRNIQLAGKHGPLSRIHANLNPKSDYPFPWHATASDIIAAIPELTEGREIVIDLKPSVAQNVSLYRLRDIWAYTDKDWTPLALLLESLFVDMAHESPAEFKATFNHSGNDGALIGEFLYVQGGARPDVGKKNTWNWGMIGRVNGTLLWPKSFEYLAGNLGRALRIAP